MTLRRGRHVSQGRAAIALLAASLMAPPLAVRARAGSGAVSGVIDLRYARAGDGAVENELTAGVRARALAGRRLAACFGLDARAGAGGGGAVYAAELYAIGLGLRSGTSHVALCAGVGGAGVSGGAVPFAWTFPVELHWEGTGAFGVVRPLLVARLVRTAGADVREDGSPMLSLADELHLAAGLRIMVPAEPLPGLATGDGVFLGLTYDEALGDRMVGVAIGYGFAAGN